MEVRAGGGQHQLVCGQRDQAAPQLHVAQLRVEPHAVHGREPAHRVALHAVDTCKGLVIDGPDLVLVVEVLQGLARGAGGGLLLLLLLRRAHRRYPRPGPALQPGQGQGGLLGAAQQGSYTNSELLS